MISLESKGIDRRQTKQVTVAVTATASDMTAAGGNRNTASGM